MLTQFMQGDERIEQNILVSNEEAYKREWQALYDSVVNGASVLTPAEHGVQDIQLMQQLLMAAR